MLRTVEVPLMKRTLSALALSAALALGGCQNPDGSTNWGNTLLLGAGVGTAAALAAGAASDSGPRYRGRGYSSRGYDRGYGYGPAYGGYGAGYGGGYYGRPYRGW